jgi:PIN domain
MPLADWEGPNAFMTEKILYVFPDTNLFAQCRPLEELDWGAFGAFDEINLIVSRPIQAEIDHQKNQGGSRLANRARSTSRLFRQVLQSEHHSKTIRESAPRLKLTLKLEHERSAAVEDRLDYSKPDDQLVGTAVAFREKNPQLDVRVLTHDTGPMASAHAVNCPVLAIPDEWLLPPETSSAEKELTRLSTELAALKRAEPQFTISCVDSSGPIRKLESEIPVYVPLSESELSSLMGRIVDRFPEATDFGSAETATRPSTQFATAIFGLKQVYVPATPQEIEAYQKERYPKWQEECASILGNVHTAKEPQSVVLEFCFIAQNEGVRPADDVLVMIEAKGNIKIMPLTSEEVKPKEPITELPRPPAPPQGKWKTEHEEKLAEMVRSFLGGNVLPATLAYNDLFDITPRTPTSRYFSRQRDPNAFYFKDRPTRPASVIELECAQWRHAIDPEAFAGQIHFDKNVSEISGAVEMRIHAGNLSTVSRLLVPVRISVRAVSVYESAGAMVDRLVEPRRA